MEQSKDGRRTIDGYILIQASPEHHVSELAERITRTPGVVGVERVNGPYDVIAMTREASDDVSASQAASAIRELDGVLRAIPVRIESRFTPETTDGRAA